MSEKRKNVVSLSPSLFRFRHQQVPPITIISTQPFSLSSPPHHNQQSRKILTNTHSLSILIIYTSIQSIIYDRCWVQVFRKIFLQKMTTSRLRATSRQYVQLQSIVQKIFDVPPTEHVVGIYSCARLSGIGLAPSMVRCRRF